MIIGDYSYCLEACVVVLLFVFKSCAIGSTYDLKLRNQLHGPMHCKISVICVYNEWTRVLNSVVITSNLEVRVMNSQVSCQCSHTIQNMAWMYR